MHGILVLDKPEHVTSMTAVSIVRGKIADGRGAKVGHAGTLDPLATGVLVLAVGNATAAIGELMATDKRYLTAIDLSAFTNTDDREGERDEVFTRASPTRETIEMAVHRFVGDFLQRPPAFSAVKIGGQRSYALARRGEQPVNAPRPVHVDSLDVIRYDWPIVELDIRCAKGFYVRSLARDLGEVLGTGGHCAAIRRTEVGPFTLEHALRIGALPPMVRQSDLLPLDAALAMVRTPG